MDFSVIDLALVTKLLLLLLIGMGPKIALVPFLEKTKHFDAETQRAVGRRMVVTAVVTALVIFALGGLLMRLLHITGGAVAVGGGIILAILAINMVAGPGKKPVEEIGVHETPEQIAVYPLAVPYLLNLTADIDHRGRRFDAGWHGILRRELHRNTGHTVASLVLEG